MSETKAMSQESEVTKLEPCPFCGASPDEQPGSLDYVTCSTEGCVASHGWTEKIDWNRRAPPADARLREAVRDAAIQECIAALWKRTEREEYGHAKAAVTLDIEALEALRSSPAASEPSKGARETPALDELVADAVKRHVYEGPYHYTATLAAEAQRKIERAQAELSALKSETSRNEQYRSEISRLSVQLAALKSAAPERPISEDEYTRALRTLGLDPERIRIGEAEVAAGQTVDWQELRAELLARAPERPAMAVEAAITEIRQTYHGSAYSERDRDELRVILRKHFTPAAASPTVKMPDDLDVPARRPFNPQKQGYHQGWNDALLEVKRLNPPASPQDGKERA